MNKLGFYSKSFSGKGWFIPLYDIFRKSDFEEEIFQLADREIFSLADILNLINKGSLHDTLLNSSFSPNKTHLLEAALIQKVNDLKSFDKFQSWILPSIFVLAVVFWFGSITIVDVYNKSIQEENERMKIKYLDNYSSITSVPNTSKKMNPSANAAKISEQEIGLWRTPVIYGGGTVRLFRKGSDFFKTERFSDGSSFTHRMKKSGSNGNMIFTSLEKISTDTWVVTRNGKLEVRDRDGIIYSVN
ncbi:hypothetical protein [Algoriphagus persicinus]|uniref:hypothetical protein n=1 Tax=Algoriphagus persicinus TaxID=3108754 RepID=UPI002B3EBA91|nr:hypothetical protein [Algoriphagus sp. E1-3-M2]MEB2784880.1 hypothetical protein [Algoriphagus sp. E1-3-M2]